MDVRVLFTPYIHLHNRGKMVLICNFLKPLENWFGIAELRDRESYLPS